MPRQLPNAPYERPNWARMHAGQRAYAMRQHNNARANRGLPPITVPDSNNPGSSTSNQAGAPSTSTRVLWPDSPEQEETNRFQTEYEEIVALLADSPIPQLSDTDWFDEFIDHDMTTLPGTAMETGEPSRKRPATDPEAAADGKGPGGAQGLAGGSVTGGYMLPMGRHLKNDHYKMYKKVHTILSYGMVPTYFTSSVLATGSSAYVTTALAKIPVEYPFLYLDPCEYATLAPGEYVVGLKVTVYMRNVRVAFETASTTSSLATLNQNKNGLSAVGLNKLGYIIDCKLTSASSAPMVPTTVTAADYTQYSTVFYGSNGATPTIPASYMGVPTPFNTYAAVSGSFPSLTPPANPATAGFPNLMEHVNRFDAADFVGLPIVEYTYKPKIGLLKQQLAGYSMSNNGYGQITVPTMSADKSIRITQLTNAANGQPENYLARSGAALVAGDFSYTTPIEKAQVFKEFNGTGYPIYQPSVHVGVAAVPSLTATAMSGIPTNWTDVQAMFDIECEMITSFQTRAVYPLATTQHIEIDQLMEKNATDSSVLGTGGSRFGLGTLNNAVF